MDGAHGNFSGTMSAGCSSRYLRAGNTKWMNTSLLQDGEANVDISSFKRAALFWKGWMRFTCIIHNRSLYKLVTIV